MCVSLSLSCSSEWSLRGSGGTGLLWQPCNVQIINRRLLLFDDFRLMSQIRYCLLFGTDTPPFLMCLDMIKSGATEGTKVFSSRCFPFELCMSLSVCGIHDVVGEQICLHIWVFRETLLSPEDKSNHYFSSDLVPTMIRLIVGVIDRWCVMIMLQ